MDTRQRYAEIVGAILGRPVTVEELEEIHYACALATLALARLERLGERFGELCEALDLAVAEAERWSAVPTIQDAVLEALYQHGPLPAAEIARVAGYDRKQVSEALVRLRRKGFVRYDGRVWRPSRADGD